MTDVAVPQLETIRAIAASLIAVAVVLLCVVAVSKS